MPKVALDPPVSEKQRRAMFAAREGHSTLGIPKSVGEKFVGPGHDTIPIPSTAPNSGIPITARRRAKDAQKRPKSEAQRRAMYAAASGKSRLDIPKSVGEEYVGVSRDMRVSDWRGLFQGLLKFLSEEMEEPKHEDDGAADSATPDAAGVCFKTSDGHVLLLKRAGDGDHKGEWDFPGGHVEPEENAEEAARRESQEEIGHMPRGALSLACRRKTGGVDFATYLKIVPKQFTPKLNDEHSDYRWVKPDAHPSPLHPGVAAALREMRDMAVEVAQDHAVMLPLAFDKSSVREYDKDGRLHVAEANISKGNICPYIGYEIPDWEKLGLQPDKVYKLLRHPDELAKGAATFNGLPILIKHKPTDADDHPADLVIGATGTDAAYSHPYLKNSLHIWPQHALDLIEDDAQKQLSSSYHYDADMTPGEYRGVPYDGVMRNIIGNHVALVKEGRAGSDVMVADSLESLQWREVERAVLALAA